MNTFYTHAYPQQWGHQPPFAGPPPMPTGVNVSQQQWQQGQWQFNPAYASQQAQPQQTLWAPSQGWYFYGNNVAKPGTTAVSNNPYVAQQQQQQQQQAAAAQQASRNPYKRYPKPPSQEYLSYQLKENGLGLFDMVPREEVYKDKEPPSGADQTPWVWHPKRFPGEEDSGIVTAYFKDEHGNRDEQYRGEVFVDSDQPTRPNSVEPRVRERERERTRSGESDSRRRDTAENETHHTSDSAQERAWEYEGERERSKEKKHKHKKDKSSKERHRSEDPSSLSSSLARTPSHREASRHATAPISSASAYAEQQAQQQAKSPTYSQAPSATRVHFLNPTTTITSAPVTPSKSQPAAEPPPTQHPQPTQPTAQEAFSSHLDLRPTFSPRIVRTPDHYRSASVVSASSTPTRPPSSARSASVVSSDFDRMSIGTSVTSVTPSPLTRHATAPAAFRGDNPDQPNLSGVSTFSDEPASLLSPLPLLQGTGRPLSRGHSAPQAGSSQHSLATIPENTPTSSLKSRSSPRRSYSPAGSGRSGGSTTDSDSNPSSPYDTHPRSSPNYNSSSSMANNNKPLKRSPLSNPLPTPPRESQIMLQAYEGPSASELQKFINPTRVRKGFWSKRGCHLTKEGEIIEPPDEHSYPPELSRYPSDPSFMDHKRRITRVDDWNQRKPYHPKRYEEYIHYVQPS